MTRVATFQNTQSALLNLQRAQAREAEASREVATEKKADDLRGFGGAAEGVAALRSVHARVAGWTEQAEQLAGRLEVQDLHLTRVMDGAAEARAAIGNALATDRGEGLMTALAAAFGTAAAGLNAEHEGKPLFAGGRVEERPFAADRLSDLTAVPDVAELFTNDRLKSATRLGEATVVRTGELADEVGTELMAVFRRVQAFAEGPDGAFGHPLTDAQKSFLQTELGNFAAAQEGLIQTVARNGSAQRRVDDILAELDDRDLALTTLTAERTEVDRAEAVTKLQAAQTAVEASARVLAALKGSSLLELLR